MNRLPEWFDEKARKNVLIDLRFQNGFIAKSESEESIGFITYFVYEAVGFLAWIGVLPEQHRIGIGTKLLNAFENDMKKNEVSQIHVYTLSDNVEYSPYEATRAFYYKNKFVEFKREKTGDPNCPEKLYLKKDLNF